MADPLADFEGIKRRRDEAVAKLSAIEAPAHARANQLINKKNRGEALTDEEKAELDDHRSLLMDVGHAKVIVGMLATQEMNDSALLSDIRAKLEGITDNLKAAKAKLKKIGEVADAVAEGVELLGKVVEDLKSDGAKALLT